MSVFENVAFPLREHRKELREKELSALVNEKLSILGLEGKGPLFPSELSGGMRKRVGLARALILEPEMLFYDEPTSGLDPLTSRRVDDLILETRARFGVTSVVISHDMAGAIRIADRIHLMESGKLVVTGTPEELVRSTHPLVLEFLTESGLDAERLLRERQARS
jgi:phospholipid/cholesterol/gamma-HCH transport system ATP-binding protein